MLDTIFFKSRSNSSYVLAIIPILSYLPLLGMKGWRKIITNNFNGKHMFRYKFYEFRLNSFKIIVNTLYLTYIYSLLHHFRALIPRGF